MLEAFPDGNSAIMLVAARLRHIAETRWGMKRYLNMALIKDMQKEDAVAQPKGHRTQKCERFLTLP